MTDTRFEMLMKRHQAAGVDWYTAIAKIERDDPIAYAAAGYRSTMPTTKAKIEPPEQRRAEREQQTRDTQRFNEWIAQLTAQGYTYDEAVDVLRRDVPELFLDDTPMPASKRIAKRAAQATYLISKALAAADAEALAAEVIDGEIRKRADDLRRVDASLSAAAAYAAVVKADPELYVQYTEAANLTVREHRVREAVLKRRHAAGFTHADEAVDRVVKHVALCAGIDYVTALERAGRDPQFAEVFRAYESER